MKWLVSAFLLVLLGGAAGCWRWYEWRDHSQDAPILAAATRYGVEPALVKAVVWRESRFNPRRRGGVGEIGLMQILPSTAGEWTRTEHLAVFNAAMLADPRTNTLAGAWYLKKLLQLYSHTDNPVPYALADYNAGRRNLIKWKQGAAETNSAAFIEQIGFPGTKSYVKSVLVREQHYLPVFPGKEAPAQAPGN